MTTDNVTSIDVRRSAAPAEAPDVFPAGTFGRLSSVTLALEGAVDLFNDLYEGGAKGDGVMGILGLAVAELTRIGTEFSELAAQRWPND
jgi:hypothetical protein